MSRSNEQWRLIASPGRPSDGSPDVGASLVVYRDIAKYRWATRLWVAAWAPTPRGAPLPVSTWTLLEGVTAVGLAALIVATAASEGASRWVAAALTALLVVLVSRWARARVAVQMPLWASDGMRAIHRTHAVTDRGTDSALTPETWSALCHRATRPTGTGPDLAEAVKDWTETRALADYAPDPVAAEDLTARDRVEAAREATARLESLAR